MTVYDVNSCARFYNLQIVLDLASLHFCVYRHSKGYKAQVVNRF